MPTELEELVDFLHHGNTQIRQISAEHLVSYSKSQPTIFKTQQLTPVTDLKLLVKDYPPIAKNALTILVNISSDQGVLKMLAEDDGFLETLLFRVTSAQEPNGNLIAMLLANLAKHPSLERLITLKRRLIPTLSPSPFATTQLIELFNVGSTGKYNKDATYEYLAYVFADLAKYPFFQEYLTTPPPTSTSPQSELDPLTAFLSQTTHPSYPRRLGTATLLRNLALGHSSPLYLLQPAHSIITPILLPLCSSNQDNITAEEMDSLPEECQFLTPEEDGKEEKDVEIVKLLLEILYLVIARGGKEARETLREKGCYVVVRECHLRWEDEDVRSGCERVVDVLMIGEGEQAEAAKGGFTLEKRARTVAGAGTKNIRGSGLPQAGNGTGKGSVPIQRPTKTALATEASRTGTDKAHDDDEEEGDEDNAIVPIF